MFVSAKFNELIEISLIFTLENFYPSGNFKGKKHYLNCSAGKPDQVTFFQTKKYSTEKAECICKIVKKNCGVEFLQLNSRFSFVFI